LWPRLDAGAVEDAGAGAGARNAADGAKKIHHRAIPRAVV
jgi:hypothetical protein